MALRRLRARFPTAGQRGAPLPLPTWRSGHMVYGLTISSSSGSIGVCTRVRWKRAFHHYKHAIAHRNAAVLVVANMTRRSAVPPTGSCARAMCSPTRLWMVPCKWWPISPYSARCHGAPTSRASHAACTTSSSRGCSPRRTPPREPRSSTLLLRCSRTPPASRGRPRRLPAGLWHLDHARDVLGAPRRVRGGERAPARTNQ